MPSEEVSFLEGIGVSLLVPLMLSNGPGFTGTLII